MKKTLIVLSILILTVSLILSVQPILKWTLDSFWGFVVKQFEKDEIERQQKIKNGEIVRGKDTILIWEDMYEIGHYSNSNHLEIHIDGLSKTILEKITKYKVVEKKLYIISDEGYAVVDKNNFCRVFIIMSEKEFVNGYSVDENGDRKYYTRYIQNKNIQYLSEFNEYSNEEQDIFNSMI